MKKIIIGIIMVLAIMSNAFSQTEADFDVGLTDDFEGVVIKKYTGKEVQVRIPSKIQDMPVREIGEKAFEGGNNMTQIVSVVIPDGVTVIGRQAFSGDYSSWSYQKKLTSVTIPATVTIIDDYAFNGCESLSSLSIPASVTKIGAGAFSGCSKLESFNIPDGITSIGVGAFSGSGVKSVKWPSAITIIRTTSNYGESHGMFRNCKNLQTVVISEGVTEIGSNAFSGCTALTSVTLPSTIEKIGRDAFQGCSTLTTITIPDTVGNITFEHSYSDSGNSGFSGCPKLTLASQAALKRRGYTGAF